MEYYKQEVDRAYQGFLQELRKGASLETAIGKTRGNYGQAIANTVQDKVAKLLLGVFVNG